MTKHFQEFLRRCRLWIDNERDVPRKFKAGSWSDEFAGRIVSELESVMIREKFSLRRGRIYLPNYYEVRISQADSLEFAGLKRELLHQELNRFVADYFRLLALEAGRREAVRIEVDPQLKKGEIGIAHQWEESFTPEIVFCDYTKTGEPSAPAGTAADDALIRPVARCGQTAQIEDEDETQIGKKMSCLYKLNISQNSRLSGSLPVFKKEIAIGRGSATRRVDVGLAGDPEVSRHHALLSYRSESIFELLILGHNAAYAARQYVHTGQTVRLTWDDQFQIGNYVMKIVNSG